MNRIDKFTELYTALDNEKPTSVPIVRIHPNLSGTLEEYIRQVKRCNIYNDHEKRKEYNK